jgi:lipopolysaccharide/colanic/teichoic acid biosynthesis glycosyltransferase
MGQADGELALRSSTVEVQELPPVVERPPIGSAGIADEALAEICRLLNQLIVEGGDITFSRGYRWAKRALDIAISSATLIVLAPLFFLIALSIKLDSPGPVFYIQVRPGYRGRPLRLLKFRTMTVGADTLTTSDAVKVRNDSRITRVGRFLRAWSLDELPQLVNVLKGEMSVVGPRPEILGWVLHNYEHPHYGRFLVPQGLTGWWQVTGRSTKSIHQKLEDDLHYVTHASFWLDLKILLKTPGAILRRDGAF